MIVNALSIEKEFMKRELLRCKADVTPDIAGGLDKSALDFVNQYATSCHRKFQIALPDDPR
ncbi:hypothetical protein GCM10027577_55200 [Spirosoma fluminis]